MARVFLTIYIVVDLIAKRVEVVARSKIVSVTFEKGGDKGVLALKAGFGDGVVVNRI